ncbi:MAG: hypothetical protein AB7N91_25220 [Candidatus Tectimicrobiota bacterium]
MRWETWRLMMRYSALIGCLCLSAVVEPALAQGEPPRPAPARRAGTPGTPAAPPGGTAAAKAPQPLAASAKITFDQQRLSVDVQEQDLPSVVERIAALGQIEIRHPEGLPNRRVSVRFSALPVVEGLKRLFRVADVPGYVLVTEPQGDSMRVRRIVFLAEEGGTTTLGARGTPRQQAVASAVPPRPAAQPPAAGNLPAGVTRVPPAQTQAPAEEPKHAESPGSGSVFDDIKSNAAARRLLSQMMHPNEQVRERAFEGLVRIFPEDEKQRALMEFLEPLMEDLTSDDKGTQDEAREEIRKLLSR